MALGQDVVTQESTYNLNVPKVATMGGNWGMASAIPAATGYAVSFSAAY